MERWERFLASLATRGGAIFVLLVVTLLGGVLCLHLIHNHEEGNQLAATFVATFTSFSGALLLGLKGSSDTTATVTSGPSGASAQVSDSKVAPASSTTASTATGPIDPKPLG